MRRSILLLPLALLIPPLLAACGGTGDARPDGPPEATVRDSAGVRIVENVDEGLPRWTLSAEPTLSIGALEGAEGETLYQVGSLARLGDGTWVVANGGTEEVRLFDAGGGYLGAIGRRGEGPGEFANLSTLLVLPGDSIAAWDSRQRRLTVFDRAGAVGRVVEFEALSTGPVRPLGRLDDGRWVVFRNEGEFSTGGTGKGYPVRSLERYAVAGPTGAAPEVVAELPSEAAWVVQTETFVSFRGIPFGADNALAVDGSRLLGGVTEHAEIRVWSADGEERERWRVRDELRPVTDAEWAAARERELYRMEAADGTSASGMLDAAVAFWDQVERPVQWPAWSRIRVSTTGETWVGDYLPPLVEGVSRRWRVFDGSGQLIRAVRTPAGFDLRWIGEGAVAGIERDDFDVEYLRLYDLVEVP